MAFTRPAEYKLYAITKDGDDLLIDTYPYYEDAIKAAYVARTYNPTSAFIVCDDHNSGKEVFRLDAPGIGEPATYAICGDAYPMVVRRISPSGKRVELSHPHTSDISMVATLRHNGHYRPVGANYSYITFGVAIDRRDPHI